MSKLILRHFATRPPLRTPPSFYQLFTVMTTRAPITYTPSLTIVFFTLLCRCFSLPLLSIIDVMTDTAPTPVITLTGLTKSFGLGDAQHNALDGVDLTIEKGEFITIMGPSGCGKTSLLNILGLLDRPTGGEYLLDGVSVERLSKRRHARIRSQQIGMVFQSFNLINRLTVLENVALPLTYKGVSRTKRLMLASDILKSFHLAEREYYMPWQLSGGQMQRVAIARALVNKPSIILADEPTGNLDSKSSHIIMEELSDLHKRGNTIVMVTHNPNLTSYASRVIHMLDGKIASDTKDPLPETTPAPKVSLAERRTTQSKKKRPTRKKKGSK